MYIETKTEITDSANNSQTETVNNIKQIFFTWEQVSMPKN